MNTWAVCVNEGMKHVTPIDDTMEHDLSPNCWCRPTPDLSSLGLVEVLVHHSFDGRERSEPDMNPKYQEKIQ